VGAKSQPKIEAVIEAAKQFESYVFGSAVVADVVAKDVTPVASIEELDEDIPY